ncbi:hypothetical protein KQI42_10865 [Tissierella sp. MSJ-40]|uniref:Uncharacterized protein n=1 Tax=Tissierella simiarum TaxID=2841534 RepID=A0ABS6E6X3_9FIRM|nr:hypothetical protein [Tissierella simiarum]MBU5438514.1 hypothetical protein [Tissierella simiarum]
MFNKSINLDEDILLKNKIPLLINDPTWTKLFGEANDKSIQNTKEELIQLVNNESNLDMKSRELQKEKLNCMKMILGVSDSVNNENKLENIELLDEYKKRIHEINEEIDEVTFQLETIPKSIKESNFNLLKATVKYGYDELKYREKVVNQVVGEIESLKEKLMELINTKHDYEEWINETYPFLHGLLGSNEMEKLDREILK